MVPLIFVDLDGTLVGSNGVVENEVWEALKATMARGQKVAVATARGAFAQGLEIAKRIDPTGWHVFHNGAFVIDFESQKASEITLTANEVLNAESIGLENGWVTEFYTGSDYVVDSNDQWAIAHASLLGVAHTCRNRDELDNPEAIVRVQFLLPLDGVERTLQAASEIGLDAKVASSPVLPGVALLSLTKLGISKIFGIELVAAELGIALASTMMVGDSLNDLTALSGVGHAVVMGNAHSEVKSAAGHIVSHVDDLGLIEALELSANL